MAIDIRAKFLMETLATYEGHIAKHREAQRNPPCDFDRKHNLPCIPQEHEGTARLWEEECQRLRADMQRLEEEATFDEILAGSYRPDDTRRRWWRGLWKRRATGGQ
jgi:hypothetical protein